MYRTCYCKSSCAEKIYSLELTNANYNPCQNVVRHILSIGARAHVGIMRTAGASESGMLLVFNRSFKVFTETTLELAITSE